MSPFQVRRNGPCSWEIWSIKRILPLIVGIRSELAARELCRKCNELWWRSK